MKKLMVTMMVLLFGSMSLQAADHVIARTFVGVSAPFAITNAGTLHKFAYSAEINLHANKKISVEITKYRLGPMGSIEGVVAQFENTVSQSIFTQLVYGDLENLLVLAPLEVVQKNNLCMVHGLHLPSEDLLIVRHAQDLSVDILEQELPLMAVKAGERCYENEQVRFADEDADRRAEKFKVKLQTLGLNAIPDIFYEIGNY